MREALRRVPAWAWLGGIVVASSALRVQLGRGMVAPFVLVDELIYAELARSLADGGGYAVRETSVSGYSLLYPALIAPAFALFDALPDAYAAAKAIGAVVMSLAAVPTYLLARRVAAQVPALLAAVASIVVPSMAYTGTITTESLFYPVSLAAALVLVLYLARPTWRRLIAVLGVSAVAVAVRSQGLVLAPTLATAPLVLAAVRGGGRAALRPFLPLYVLLAGGTLALVVLQTVRGRSLSDLLGAYSVVGESGYDAGSVLRFWLWHVEELTLYAGVVPVAVLVVLVARAGRLPERLQEHVAVTATLAFWSTLVVGAFASRFASDRVQDRYLFFLVPLLVVAVVGWIELGAPRPQPLTALVAVATLVLVVLFPYVRFIGEPAKSDTLGVIPLWSVNDHLVAGSYWATVAVVGGLFVAAWLLVPARLALTVPVVLVLLFAGLSRPVWSGAQGFTAASRGALFQGIRSVDRDWIDRAVPPGSEVAVLWTGRADRFTVNQNEFFNERLGRVYYTDAPTPGGIGETQVTRVAGGRATSGVYVLPDDRVVDAPYALLDGSITPDGVAVARDEALGTTLWRLTGPLSSRETVEGLSADGNWSGPRVTWTLLRCRPGTLAVDLHSDPTLFAKPQTVTAVTRSSRASVRFRPEDRARLEIAVAPGPDGSCAARFAVTPTANPSKVIPGSTDDRELGVHFDAFRYEQDR